MIVNENIKAVRRKKVLYETKSKSDGTFELELKVGTYNLEFGGNSFIPYIAKDFVFANSFEGEFQKDVILKPKDPEPCGYAGTCPPIIKEIYKIVESRKEFTKTIRTKD